MVWLALHRRVFMAGACVLLAACASQYDTQQNAAFSTEGMSLDAALSGRRSVREFTDEPLSEEQLLKLAWAAQGMTHPDGLRTAPSAGALYPLELYVVTAQGVWHYEPAGGGLTRHRSGDARLSLWRNALEQDPVLRAPAVFVIAAVIGRTAAKYGDRAERYVILETGHAAQNLLLEAVSLNLGAVPIGAFDDGGVTQALSLPTDHTPFYLIPVGKSKERAD
ncbi:MAG: SagB/ThcOx family dehydrogenase [Candidatus Peregrinibacteria bacterium]